MISRRLLVSILAGCSTRAGLRAGTPVRDGRRSPEQSCDYHAKATVLMLSVPLFTRGNVGGGYLRVEETARGAESLIRIEFGAGSNPERAAGLNRFGLFEEAIVESRGELARAAYFGFMTSSEEKNLSQARSALASGKPNGLTAIRGRIEAGRVWNRLLRLPGPLGANWRRIGELSGGIRAQLDAAPGSDPEVTGASKPWTFLYSIRHAMRAPSDRGERCFVHNGELYTLRVVSQRDSSYGAKAARSGIAAAEDVVAMTGHIRAASGRNVSTFRIWFDSSSPQPVPIRFDFSPRSFLRLSFERSGLLA